MRQATAGAGMELHNRADAGFAGDGPCHTSVTSTQVFDLQGFLSDEI
jgi:hypothetical protein